MKYNNRAYITRNEADLLSRLAESSKADIVEIGTWEAGTTEILAQSTKHAVWSIDNYSFPGMDPSVTYKNWLEKYDNVALIIGDSQKVGKLWQKDIGLLFIDGSHKYTDVKADYHIWSQYVIPGGFILFHDSAKCQKPTLSNNRVSGMHGVVKFVNELNDRVEIIDSISVFQKEEYR